METTPLPATTNCVSDTVHDILPQIVKSRKTGALSQEEFENQVRRISAERFQPRGLALQMKEISAEKIRFLIIALQGGILCHTVDLSV